jgi:hypothetical protein
MIAVMKAAVRMVAMKTTAVRTAVMRMEAMMKLSAARISSVVMTSKSPCVNRSGGSCNYDTYGGAGCEKVAAGLLRKHVVMEVSVVPTFKPSSNALFGEWQRRGGYG